MPGTAFWKEGRGKGVGQEETLRRGPSTFVLRA